MKGFAAARVEKIIRNAGAHRVSAGAIEELNEQVTDRAMEIASKTVNIA
jgi:histone H3/H4